jgi:hypothetical protein
LRAEQTGLCFGALAEKTAYAKQTLIKGSCRLRFDIGFEQRY